MEAKVTRWISVAEVADHLGLACDTVYRWIDTKGMPAHRVGRFWKFQLSELDTWVKSGDAEIANEARPDEGFGDSMKQRV